MSDLITSMARLNEAAQTLRDHAGSDASRALVAWLDLAIAAYKDDLLDVGPQGLAALQAQVRQLEALKALARGAVQTNGRI